MMAKFDPEQTITRAKHGIKSLIIGWCLICVLAFTFPWALALGGTIVVGGAIYKGVTVVFRRK